MNEDQLFDGTLEEYIRERGEDGLGIDHPRRGYYKKICIHEYYDEGKYVCTLEREGSSGRLFIWLIHRHVLKSDNDLPVTSGERWGWRMDDVVSAVAAGKMTKDAIPQAVDLLL